MVDYVVRHILPYTSGLPGDEVVNTWAVTDLGAGDIEAAADAFEAFYTEPIVEDGPTLGSAISDIVNRDVDGCRIEVAILNTATGDISPTIFTRPFGMPYAVGTVSLPFEVALCTSFRSSTDPAVAAGRRRGRVYIGPFMSGFGTESGVVPVPAPILVQLLAGVTERMVVALAAAEVPLCVWSRADSALRVVTDGWVDNAWDTMRSREVEATSRESWLLV